MKKKEKPKKMTRSGNHSSHPNHRDRRNYHSTILSSLSSSSSSYYNHQHNNRYNFNKSMNDNFEYVMNEVSRNGHNLKHASDHLKNNIDICMSALKSDKKLGFKSLNYIGSQMRKNSTLLKEAINIFGEHVIRYFDSDILKEFSVMATLIEKNPDTTVVPKDIFDNESFCYYAIKKIKNIKFYHRISDRFKTDERFVLNAITNHNLTREVLLYIPDYMKDNDFIFFTSINSTEEILYMFSSRIRESKPHVLACIHRNKNNFKYISDQLKHDTDIIKTMILLGTNVKEILDENLLNNTEYMNNILSKL